ncbi:acylneuraminate cytidylyltransferase [Paenibacillus sp. FSL R5-192]|uniref:cytidylyltransferase domain-containing protein n=1 Tax=Paenibacillus sp. FSL R5-192 TaxID=1226754 RepID=UPI0003E26A20|nr:glycosyltransferase family protein [Paenibacillus sp. FSL R5-192]ETT41086.1 acylneuraminate cytidylyltransferase [Paenibacillus sp. FSL R5-192]
MNFTVIIQARMGSTRLPGKVLMPLGESNVLGYVVSRCREIKHVSQVVVATTTLDHDDEIEKWCSSNDVHCFRGSEEDVLARYHECAKKYSSDYVIRVTSDCPFLDFDLATRMIEVMMASPSDILVCETGLPRGIAVEIISFSALNEVNSIGKEARHREHVTYYAYENLGSFTYVPFKIPPNLKHPHLRITLDTPEDYMLCQAVADNFINTNVSTAEVIDYLLKTPQVTRYNSHIEQKPVI